MNRGLGIRKGSHESSCPSAIQTDEDYSGSLPGALRRVGRDVGEGQGVASLTRLIVGSTIGFSKAN